MNQNELTRTLDVKSTTKTNVLVVDDRPDGLLALEAALSSENYNLVKADSGQQALEFILYYDFAVILLDVQMPELDGFETAKLIRQNYRSRSTPIIFVTAISKEIWHINQGYENGAVDYIFKPLDPFVLRSKVGIFVELFNKNLQIKHQAAQLAKMELREKERQMLELKQESLRRFVNLADAVPHIIIKIQPDGKVEYFNRRWYEYTGMSDRDEIDWAHVIHASDKIKFFRVCLITQRKKLLASQVEVRLRREDDSSYRWHLIRIVAEVKAGEIIGWIGTCTDIDNIKKAEERFRLLSEELNRSNNELEQFAFVASHDLQEPLKIVNSYMDLLDYKYKNKLDSNAQEIIGFAKEGAQQAQKLIRDLLEYARVGMKQKAYDKVNFQSVLEKAISNISLLVQDRSAQITYEGLPTLVADEIQMVQLFQNLLSNSLKYCEKTPKVHIKAERKGREWIFSFRDNGIGIDEKYFDRIFVIFQRLHLLNKYQGTGIGLSICKKIVEKHSGKIWVESQLNTGTIFYFSILELSENMMD
jgi:PAS domain S-box-containing protein